MQSVVNSYEQDEALRQLFLTLKAKTLFCRFLFIQDDRFSNNLSNSTSNVSHPKFHVRRKRRGRRSGRDPTTMASVETEL